MLQVSQQFTLRMMKDSALVAPIYHENVTDDVFMKVIMVSGRHQRTLDVSRCSLISSTLFSKLSICRGLRHLDVSYTNFSDISCVSGNCLVLQSLVLAGLKLSSYEPISQLTTLQLLNLNFSNITALSPLSTLCRLRSLDLGNTPVSCVTSLGACTMLEELILDATGIQRTPVPKEDLTSLSSLTSLKSLNIAATSFMTCVEDLSASLSKQIYLEITPRRNKWFEAIIVNDVKTVNSLLSQGFDVELRAGPWASKILLEAWHGPQYKSQPAFFDCSSKVESHRPMGYHFALLFNSKEVLAALLSAKTPKDLGHVWYGPVTGGVQAMVPNPAKLTSNSKVLFTTAEFLKMLVDRRVHVIIENLRETNPGGWVAQAGNIVQTLRSVLEDPRYLEKQLQAKLLKAGEDAPMTMMSHLSAPDLVQGVKEEAGASAPVNFVERRLKTETLQQGANASQRWREHPMVAKLTKPVPLPAHPKSGVSVASRAIDVHGGSTSKPELPKSRSMPAMNQTQTKLLHHAKNDPKEADRRTMLGPVSFWLESKADALREKANARFVDADRSPSPQPACKQGTTQFISANEVIEEEGEDLEAVDVRDYRSNTTLLERKDVFLDLLQTRADIARKAHGNHNGRRSSKSR